MTALLIDQVPASAAKPRLRAVRGANVRPASAPQARRPVAEVWRHVPANPAACADVVPAVPVAKPVAQPAAVLHRYEWTRRGLAVLLAAVGLLLAILLGTVVGVFLSISNEPVPATAPALTMAVSSDAGSHVES
ncbi:hypothetical protein [Nigerium massiliense]|uniref:hypothetical protein n=1 Tax=Nigerium massiliense TaxID=1522317 RepID=UPI00058B73B4|nr:hypothetical protein [Nigerium massiliense]